MYDDLQIWKEELETKKQEILDRKENIERMLEKYRNRFKIVSSIKKEEQFQIAEKLQTEVYQYERELEEYLEKHNPELVEIEALLKKINKELEKY
ncbi:hypothetical protein KS419_18475 [Bacillus tamaricis]|uniref:Uncharacterized protein n=1 Tax=Evansella tamaricis TaxID=2069301 RepID=A0ABS6JJ61_9BACI|nr:hypothetical protein [Evansella tamaricis]MBU9713717.1 hypothetical protein [Evansella tamaricis]